MTDKTGSETCWDAWFALLSSGSQKICSFGFLVFDLYYFVLGISVTLKDCL